MSDKKTALYRWFDHSGTLLYVGISFTLPDRIKQHARGSAFFEESSSMTIEWYATREEALAAERKAIIEEKPIYNKVHNSVNSERSEDAFDESYFLDTSSRPRYILTTSQLRYINGMYRVKNANILSDLMGVSQPSITSGIRKLEESIGMRIYDRIGSSAKYTVSGGWRAGVEFTQKGKLVAAAAQELEWAFLEFERRVRAIKETSDAPSGKPRRYLNA